MEFSAFVKLKVPGLTEEQIESACDYLYGVRELVGPIAGGGREPDTIGMQYNVEARSPRKAIEIGLKHLCHALGCKDGIEGDALIAMEAEPFVDPAEKELVTKAEIARRLEISPTRVSQLAETKDFPRMASRLGVRTTLYRWGDVLYWERLREDRVKRHGSPGKHHAKRQSAGQT